MPGPAVHHLIAERLRAQILNRSGLGSTLSPAQYDELGVLLADPKNLPYFYLGCQGPDFLFFNTKDMPAPLKDLVTAYYDVGDFIENFKETVKSAIPDPIIEALEGLDEAANAVVESSSTLSELKETLEDLGLILEGLAGNLTEAVKKYISDFALFDILEHPYRDGTPTGVKAAGFDVLQQRTAAGNPWWWFDTMHYRHTGKFARYLLQNSTPGSPEHLYAIGYLTHVTADTVGHPYVNAISGGPYRSQAQRHKASENYQDVLNWQLSGKGDWNRSSVHALYNFNFTGPVDTEEEVPDPFTQLPPQLAQLIVAGLNAVYNEDSAPPSPDYAKQLSPDDLNDTYRLWYKWFKSATDTGTLPKPIPYSFTEELQEVLDKAMDDLGNIGDFLDGAADTAGDMGIWGIFLLLGALIIASVALAMALVNALAGLLTTVGSATIRYVAYAIYEALYNAFESFRLAVAMNGLAFPMQEHLADARIIHFANPSFRDVTGTNAVDLRNKLPMLRFTAGGLHHNERHLVYPPTDAELPDVFAVPNSYLNQFSTFYAFGTIPQQQDLMKKLRELVPNAVTDTNDDGSQLTHLFHEKGLLGNALALTNVMYDWQLQGNDLPDFNLDGDRGYGFLCWAQQGDPAPDFPNPLTSEEAPPVPVALNFIR